MSKTAFEAKLSNFKNRFKSLLGAKAQVSGGSGRSVAIGRPAASARGQSTPLGLSGCAQGYDELNTLERPLVSDVHEQEEYERQHGVVAPGAAAAAGYRPATASAYRPPQPGGGPAGYPPRAAGAHGAAAQGVPMPSQVCAPAAARLGLRTLRPLTPLPVCLALFPPSHPPLPFLSFFHPLPPAARGDAGAVPAGPRGRRDPVGDGGHGGGRRSGGRHEEQGGAAAGPAARPNRRLPGGCWAVLAAGLGTARVGLVGHLGWVANG
jgi:hypothetical protein